MKCQIVTMMVCACLGGLMAPAISADDLFKVDTKLWTPVEDDVYLQEFGSKIKTNEPVTALAVHAGKLYAVRAGVLCVLDGASLTPVPGVPEGVTRLWALNGDLWTTTVSTVYRFADGAWKSMGDLPMEDLCMHRGALYGATRDALYRLENGVFVDVKPETGYLSSDGTMLMEDGSQVLADPVKIGPLSRIASYNETLYMIRRRTLALLDGITPTDNPFDWGSLPSPNLRELLPFGSCLYVATDRGLGVVRGMSATAIRGADGLPYEDITCLARGFDADLWIGTTGGAIRKTQAGYQFFGAKHWLLDNNVHALAVGDNVVYVGTDAGVGIIRYEAYTLRKKAALFERELEEWGMKRMGFTHPLSFRDGEWTRNITDNDGGVTAHYLAAMSFKYAATGEESARQEAVNAFKALYWLGQITHSPGFIARAIWSFDGDKGEMSNRGSGGLPAKWNATPDGKWAWKGDTSSDEVNGHIYAVSTFLDLAAQGAEKEAAKKHLVNIASHILDNGLVLRDTDGKPTRWGRWDENYLLRPYGFSAAGLNGMEVQTYMRVAYGVSHEKKFEEGFEKLVKLGYPQYTVRQKLTFPPDQVVSWDDELAFRCYYPLLRHTEDPTLRSTYIRSLQRTWEVLRIEHVAWFNFIYGAITGNDCETEQATQFLRDWPIDMVQYHYKNSHRADLFPEPGYRTYTNAVRAFSPRETSANLGADSMLRPDGHGAGLSAVPPIGWMEAYWMGRYHGFIKPPTTTDSNLISVPETSGEKKGAAPYQGTPRPENLFPTAP